MATSVTPPLRKKSYAELEKRISQLEQVRTSLAVPLPATPQRSRLLTIIETVGLVAIAGAIFWLGTLHKHGQHYSRQS